MHDRKIHEMRWNEAAWIRERIGKRFSTFAGPVAVVGFGSEFMITGGVANPVWTAANVLASLAAGSVAAYPVYRDRERLIAQNKPCCDFNCNGGDFRLFR